MIEKLMMKQVGNVFSTALKEYILSTIDVPSNTIHSIQQEIHQLVTKIKAAHTRNNILWKRLDYYEEHMEEHKKGRICLDPVNLEQDISDIRNEISSTEKEISSLYKQRWKLVQDLHKLVTKK